MIEKLRSSPIFADLSAPALEHLQERVNRVHLEPKEVLFEKGDKGEHLYTVLEGLLKISLPDPVRGREKTVAILGEGEIVGEMATLGDQKRSGKASAIRDTILFKVSRETFLDLLREYPQIGLNVIRVLSRRLMMSDEEIQTVTFKTIPGRLAAQLLKLGESFGEPTEEGVHVQIPLTHQQLADLVGTNRETVTRHLNKFTKEGSIVIEDHEITILDRQALEEWM